MSQDVIMPLDDLLLNLLIKADAIGQFRHDGINYVVLEKLRFYRE
jgi:hypothetical protein